MDGEWKMNIYTTRDIKKKDKVKEKRKTYYVGIDRQFSPTPRYLTPLETTILHPLKPNAFVKNPFQEYKEEDEFIPITQKDHVLQNVTVRQRGVTLPMTIGDGRTRRMESNMHHFIIMLTESWMTSLIRENLCLR